MAGAHVRARRRRSRRRPAAGRRRVPGGRSCLHDDEQPEPDRERHRDADDAGHARWRAARRRRPRSRSRPAGRRRGRGRSAAARSPCRSRPCSRPSGWELAEGADEEGEHQRHGEAQADEAGDGHGAAAGHHATPTGSQLELGAQVAGAVDQVGPHRQHHADGERRDDALADADEHVHADHGGQHRAGRGRPLAAERVLKTLKTTEAATTDANAGDTRRPRPRRQRCRAGPGAGQPEQRVADERRHEGHDDDVEPEGAQTAVGEQQGLHEQHHRHAQAAQPGPDQDRRQAPAEQVAAGPAGHREVEHLHGEDEGRHQPGHRDLLVVERLAPFLMRVGEAAGRDDAGRQRDRGVDEPVGDVHAALLLVASCSQPVGSADHGRRSP